MSATLRPTVPKLLGRQRDAEDCPSGFRFHSCVLNAFRGCCSVDPCARGFTCPDNNQPKNSATTSVASSNTVTSSTTPSDPASPGTMAAPNPISPTPNPTIVSSVGPALGNGQPGLATDTLPPSQTSFITNLPTSPTITFGATPSATGASSSLAPSSLAPPNSLTPAPSAISSADTNNGNSNSNSQGYPIGLIAGVVTGFSILMLVMGVLFVVLWRNKRTKVTSDTEAAQMRGRNAIPFYYVPPPTQDEKQQQQQQKGIDSGASTPVRSTRFASEVEVMTPPSRRGVSSPRRIGDPNKPSPSAQRDAQSSVQTPPSSQPLNGDISTPLLAFPGRPMDYPDPLRADGLAQPPTGARAVHFTPVKANLIHNRPPSSSRSSSKGDFRDSNISPSSTIPGSIAATASIRSSITTTVDYEQTLRRHFRRFSGLIRSDSTTAAHALSPPPRRPKTGDSEAASSMGEGKLSRQPGLRLSGIDQGTSGEGQRESMSGDETDQRATWYGDGKVRAGADNVTSPTSENRRYSK